MGGDAVNTRMQGVDESAMGAPRCRVQGCDRPTFNYRRGLCQTHYVYLCKGTPYAELRPILSHRAAPASGTCLVPGCEKPVRQKRLCSTHARYRSQGVPLDAMRPVQTYRPRGSPPAPCGVTGCKRAAHARGLCQLHYQRHRKGYDAKEMRLPRYRKGRMPKAGRFFATTPLIQREMRVMHRLSQQGWTAGRICAQFNRLGRRNAAGRPFTPRGVRWRLAQMRRRAV